LGCIVNYFFKNEWYLFKDSKIIVLIRHGHHHSYWLVSLSLCSIARNIFVLIRTV
jgi:hypothetical protein